MLRSIGKTCFAAAYTLADGGRRFAMATKDRLRAPFIVCYHRVVENFDYSSRHTIPSLLVSTAMLERHVDWLARRFEIVSLDDIGLHFQGDRSIRRPAAAITFDDGYSDVYHHAYPLLQRKGVPWAAFVVSGLVGTGRPQIFDRLYFQLRRMASRGVQRARVTPDESLRVMTGLLTSLPTQAIEELVATLERNTLYGEDLSQECAPMTWDMIETMHRNGVTIGSHTKSHTLLTCNSLESVRQELTESKQTLELKLRARISHFAYPDGRFNPSVVQAVRSAGYEFAYGICLCGDRSFPSLTIPRKVLWERSCLNAAGRFSPSIMNCQANWVFDAKDRCEHDHSAAGIQDTHATFS